MRIFFRQGMGRNAAVGTCPTLTFLPRERWPGISLVLAPEKSSPYSIEYGEDFSVSVVAHLSFSPSPRNNWPCRAGSWPIEQSVKCTESASLIDKGSSRDENGFMR